MSRHLLEHDLPHLVDDIEVVVSELATNAMAHAQTPFTVILCAFDETVVLEVSDESRAEPRLGVLSRASGGKSVWAEFDSTARPRALLAVAHRHSTGFSQGAPH